MAQARLKETQAKENIFFYRFMQALAKVWKAPWQVKASVLVMGLGQICYGQIIKGLIYLACLAGLIWYFVTTGAADFIGFFTLGTQQEDLWLGIPGDNSMNMLILGIFAIVIGLFTDGFAAFDEAYEEGIIDKIFTTNLAYRKPEILEKPWYVEVNMCKYVAHIIDTLNHDTTISSLLDPNTRIAKLLEKHRAEQA